MDRSHEHGLFYHHHKQFGTDLQQTGGSVSNFQAALLAAKVVAQGDFDVHVDFTNLSDGITSGSTGNQLQLNTRFGGQDFLVVRSDEFAFGQNAHVWIVPPAGPYGEISWAPTSGTLRVTRTNTTVTGYIDSTLIYQNTFNTNDATFSIVLQNNGTTDAISATFRNFSLSANALVTLPQQVAITNSPSNSVVLSWKDKSWPDTLQGYHILSTTNLASNSWQFLSTVPTVVSNTVYYTNSNISNDAASFYDVLQGPTDYH